MKVKWLVYQLIFFEFFWQEIFFPPKDSDDYQISNLSLIFILHIATFSLEEHPVLPDKGLKPCNSVSSNVVGPLENWDQKHWAWDSPVKEQSQ